MSPDRLDTTFAALADPTRRAILARLASGEASVGELAEPFDMSLPAVSKHLKVLERAGLIGRSRTAQWRPCRLEAGPLKEAAEWIEHYRRFWDESFDRLERDMEIGVEAAAVGRVSLPRHRAERPQRNRPQSQSDRLGAASRSL
jgi:DNA-binding transcriptional ArsR family regulator